MFLFGALLTSRLGVIGFVALLLPSVCLAETRDFQTSVVPQQGETLAGACVYRLKLPASDRSVRGVLVIFERGEQVRNLYSEGAVVQFAAQNEFGILLAQHCPAKRSKDIDVVPANG